MPDQPCARGRRGARCDRGWDHVRNGDGLPSASSRIAYGEPHGGVTMSVVVEHLGHVTQLTLDRQDAANAINIEMALGIAEAIDAFAADTNARVLVVTGA